MDSGDPEDPDCKPRCGELWLIDEEWILPRLRYLQLGSFSKADPRPPHGLIIGAAPSESGAWFTNPIMGDKEVLEVLVDGDIHFLHRSWFRKRISL
jgi:hypothetical protein